MSNLESAPAPLAADHNTPVPNQTGVIDGMISTSRVDEDGRAQRRTGGSAQTIPSRRRSVSRKSSPIDRARETLGEETVRQLQQTYRSLDSTWGGSEHNQAEGMVLSLIRQGVADAQIRAIFGGGGSMIQRLKGVIKNGIDTLHTRRRGTTPKHAFSEDDIGSLKTGFRAHIGVLGNILWSRRLHESYYGKDIRRKQRMLSEE
ncbi:hypothetical protein PPTG_07246 [Phytophthora nicotianae INRA-310]|uniref:Uncharacterized protein n=1 Tax=Phytophthora nicotianae (strain INRA-310) TaxID=761204 RepID=W2QPI9_PHYN3|nr:hypothetical protein PPTG_07246 [Phytophthora nicotianae INRA-310]ETN15028.1 hypothetical protein PPTG_07246 [Phytophthora nicotianae INRA-310]